MEDIASFIISTEYDGKSRRLYPSSCKKCGNIFYAPRHANKKYCRDGCYRIDNKPIPVLVPCDYCGKPVVKNPSKLSKSKSGYYFCDRRCKDEGQRVGSHLQKMRPKHFSDGRHTYRAIALRRLPMECNRCKWNVVTGVLKVHHRDRDRSNNALDNLEILCPNCHDTEHYLNRDGNYTGGRKKVGIPGAPLKISYDTLDSNKERHVHARSILG